MPQSKKSTPNQTPPGEQAAGAEAGSAPSQTPPGATEYGGNTVADSRPKDLSAEDMAITVGAGQAGAAPSLVPPREAAGEGGVTAWVNDRRVNALWGINQNRNSWVSIAGIGWKKLANNSDSAIVALTILAAHARQMQTNYTYREEADGMIYECYVW